jgi:thiol-disulfide isomerase/thioredoxin
MKKGAYGKIRSVMFVSAISVLILAFAVPFAGAAGAAGATGADGAADEGLSLGSVAPNIIGRTVDGKIFRLNKLDAKLKVVNFWWVKCIPCKKEMPELAELEKKYPDVEFVSVHTSSNDEKGIQAFLDALSAHPTTIVKSTKKVMEMFKFASLPHTVVLDKNNKVVLVLVGFSEKTMEKLNKVLAGAV